MSEYLQLPRFIVCEDGATFVVYAPDLLTASAVYKADRMKRGAGKGNFIIRPATPEDDKEGARSDEY